MYSFLIDDKGHTSEKHRAKGIKRGASGEIRHQQYPDQLQRPAENYLPNHRKGARSTRSTRLRLVKILGLPSKNTSVIDVIFTLIVFLVYLFDLRRRSVDCALSTTSASRSPTALPQWPKDTTPFHREWSKTHRQGDRTEPHVS